MNAPNEPKPLGAEDLLNALQLSHDILLDTHCSKSAEACEAAATAIRQLTSENATLEAERDMLEKGESELINERDSLECVVNDLCKAVGHQPGVDFEWTSEYGFREAIDDVGEKWAALTAERDQLKARVAEISMENTRAHGSIARLERDCTINKNAFELATKQLSTANAQNAELRATIGTPPEGSHPDEAKPRAATWHAERLNWISEVARMRNEATARHEKTIEMLRRDGGLVTQYRRERDSLAGQNAALIAKAALAQAGGPLCVNCGIGFILPSGVCDHCDTKQAGGKVGV